MTDPGGVLVVCTGNVCRSPFIQLAAAARARRPPPGRRTAHRCDQRGRRRARRAGDGRPRGGAGDGVRPGSLGLRRPAADRPDGGRGGPGLTATRKHRGEVATLHPKALRYVFALRDFADLAAAPRSVTGWRRAAAVAGSSAVRRPSCRRPPRSRASAGAPPRPTSSTRSAVGMSGSCRWPTSQPGRALGRLCPLRLTGRRPVPGGVVSGCACQRVRGSACRRGSWPGRRCAAPPRGPASAAGRRCRSSRPPGWSRTR